MRPPARAAGQEMVVGRGSRTILQAREGEVAAGHDPTIAF